MNHTDCRRTIVLDEVDAAASDHLQQCAVCRSFADDVRRLDALAPTLAATPPAGLEDRIMARLRQEAPRVPEPGPRSTRPGWRDSFAAAWRTTGVRLTAAAAALVLVAAVVGVLRNEVTATPADVVLASARAAADSGSAQVAVSATTEVVLEAQGAPEPGRRPSDPSFSAAPRELRPYFRREWEQAMADFERQMQRFLDQMDAAIDDGSRQIDDALREMERAFSESFGGRGAPGERPRPTRPPRPEMRPPAKPGDRQPPPPEPPRTVRAEIAVDARGTVDFAGEHLALQGAVRAGGEGAAPGRPFRVAADSEAAAYQSARGQWTRLPGPAGPMGTVLLDPQAVLRVTGAVEGDGEALGEAEIAGETVQRYRLALDEQALGAEARIQGEWTAEAYVGDDGRLRRLQLISQPVEDRRAGVHWQSQVDLDLSGYGTATASQPMPQTRSRASLPQRSSLLLYPLGPSVTEALAGAGS